MVHANMIHKERFLISNILFKYFQLLLKKFFFSLRKEIVKHLILFEKPLKKKKTFLILKFLPTTETLLPRINTKQPAKLKKTATVRASETDTPACTRTARSPNATGYPTAGCLMKPKERIFFVGAIIYRRGVIHTHTRAGAQSRLMKFSRN